MKMLEELKEARDRLVKAERIGDVASAIAGGVDALLKWAETMEQRTTSSVLDWQESEEAENDCQSPGSQEGLPPMDSTKPCPVCGTDKKLVWGYSASATKETLSYRCSMCGHRDYLKGYEP